MKAALWSAINHLHNAGLGPVSALAGIVYPGRRFSVDSDGHWVNRQAEATFVSPDPHGRRYSRIVDRVRDDWFHCYTPKPGDLAFDIGAGMGEEAVVFSHLVSNGKVVSVEADPVTFSCLSKTVDRSQISNVIPVHCALMDKDGELFISTTEHHIGRTVLASGDVAVPGRSLHSLCDQLGINRIDFLKMNIEGAERVAIRGFGTIEILNLVISCHDFIEEGPDYYWTRSEVEAFLHDNGYHVTTRPDHPNPWTRHHLYATMRK